MVISECQVFLRRIEKKNGACSHHGKKHLNEQKGTSFIISVAGCEPVVNAWQKKKTSPRGAHRKGYDQ